MFLLTFYIGFYDCNATIYWHFSLDLKLGACNRHIDRKADQLEQPNNSILPLFRLLRIRRRFCSRSLSDGRLCCSSSSFFPLLQNRKSLTLNST
ncbi:hypothetical protein L6452_17177 [Arctium lappa]|uniref:Uncharacterized protein n=1 Tax=Arctium lappa TaxID=4217 RepID=A0ACB9C2U3_ARCLA|nr:hypothetical protein L6452_17177 [Arctium lappa]